MLLGFGSAHERTTSLALCFGVDRANDTSANTFGSHTCDSFLKGNNVFVIVLKEILTALKD
jgi:hypothetical protein